MILKIILKTEVSNSFLLSHILKFKTTTWEQKLRGDGHG